MTLSLWESVSFLPKVAWILVKILFSAVTAPFRSGRARVKTFSIYIQQRKTQAMFYTFTARQLQFIFPTWLEAYETHMTRVRKPVFIENVYNSSTRGVWFGDPSSATTIAVYYPGGGHVIPGLAIHAAALDRWVSWCEGRLAIFAIEYSLSPQDTYPVSLGEAVEAVRFVIEGVGRDKDIVVCGDSAGGQLAIAVLSHIGGHPHPDSETVKALDLGDKKLTGAVVLSPWTSSDTSKFPSITDLSGVDIIGPSAVKYWSALYKDGKPSDEYSVPEMAAVDWWISVGDVVDSMLILVGENEALKDAIKSWAYTVQQALGSSKVRLVAGEGECHNEPLALLPDTKLEAEVVGHEKTTEGALRNWLRNLVCLRE